MIINLELVVATILGNLLTVAVLLFAYSLIRFIAYVNGMIAGKVSTIDQLRAAGRKIYADRYKAFLKAESNPDFPSNELKNHVNLMNACAKEYKLTRKDVALTEMEIYESLDQS